MNIYTKEELLKMSDSDIDKARKEAWNYYKKVGAVQEFKELED